MSACDGPGCEHRAHIDDPLFRAPAAPPPPPEPTPEEMRLARVNGALERWFIRDVARGGRFTRERERLEKFLYNR